MPPLPAAVWPKAEEFGFPNEEACFALQYGHGIGFYGYGPTYVAAPDCYVVKRVIDTPYGPRVRRVTVCD